MKIVFVTSHLTVFVGYGKFLMDYANKLCEMGHSITIIALKIDKDKYQFNKDILIIEVGGPLLTSPFFWLRINKIRKKYVSIIEKLQSDIIISLNFPSNYFCAGINKDIGIKHVYYCQEPYRFFHDKKFYSSAPFSLKLYSRVLRILFKKYDIKGTLGAKEIISISNFTKKRIKEWYGRDSLLHYIGVNIDDENSIIMNDFNIKDALKLKTHVPIIFTLGLTHHLKGARELIIIFRKVLNDIPDAVLIIGGWIKEENKKVINKLVKKLKIPNENLIIPGFIEDSLLNSFYAKATLTFYNAIDEAFGLIPLESMKNGTPVIAFEGGPSETIIDKKTGYVIKTDDLDDFTQKAIELITNIELREEFSKECKEHVRKHFSYDTCISNFESILIGILSRR